ncbi:MAG TPA: calcium/sodium antiporter [Longimicrobiaceae bacterium]|nr:calcium/sodium antiporter [Longimicrobiaceae bacterium]
MLLQAILFCVGAAALYLGAEWLVRGSSRLARSFGVSALVVGLTVVALGTSAPELVVSTIAAVRGQGGVAVGNVVGSNILNLALIVGVASLAGPMHVQMRLLHREAPLMVLAALTLPLLAWDGAITRLDGGLLAVAFLGYLAFVVRSARTEPPAVKRDFEAFEEAEDRAPAGGSRLRDAGIAAAGLATLVVGAQMLVDAAVFFARAAGVSEVVVGLTVVAVGTSLPELATSVVAALRGEADIAMGNIVGSNIFNSLIILGSAALARPILLDRALFAFEIPAMVAISVIFPVLAYTRRTLRRLEGAFLVACYVAFTGVLLMRTVG